jgi:transposase-like protein
MNMIAFLKAYGTDEACRAHMESVRWPNGPSCPKCGSVNEAGVVGNRAGLFRCRPCGTQFTVTVGTAMEGTHLPLRHWYLAMYLMLSTAKPISAMSLSRQMGIQYRTCWHLLHRLRAMLAAGEALPLAGVIEADETYVGGKPRKGNKRDEDQPNKRGRGTKKVAVIGAVERNGRVVARVADPRGLSAKGIGKFLSRFVDPAGTLLITDEFGGYNKVSETMLHAVIKHAEGCADGLTHTNTIESFWAIIKRAWYGTHHHYSRKYMPLYIAEATYKYNRRKVKSAFGQSIQMFVGARA